MREIKLGRHDITLYDAADELPEARWVKFQKYLMLESGIGSDSNAVEAHVDRLEKLISDKTRQKEAMTELRNLRQTLHFINAGVNPQSLAFAVMIKSIDGIERDNISESGIEETRQLINDIAHDKVAITVESLKKKFNQSWLHISLKRMLHLLRSKRSSAE